MDVSRRRTLPSNVAAGSVWESRMKMDEGKVGGGGEMITSEEETTSQEDGVKPMRQRRKTWKPEPLELIGGTPIQVRKPRSDPHKLFTKSFDGIEKNPVFVKKNKSLFDGFGKLDLDGNGGFDDEEEMKFFETPFVANVNKIVNEENKVEKLVPISSNVKKQGPPQVEKPRKVMKERKTWKPQVIGGNSIEVRKSRSEPPKSFSDKSSDGIEKSPIYFHRDEDESSFDDEENQEEEVVEKEIEGVEKKNFEVEEDENPIPMSEVDEFEENTNKEVKEEKKLDEFVEKPIPISSNLEEQEQGFEVDVLEEKPKKVVKEERRKTWKQEPLEGIGGGNPIQVRKSRHDHQKVSSKSVHGLEKNPVIKKARSLFHRNRNFDVDVDVDDFDDEDEKEVIEKDIKQVEKKSLDVKEVERPISVSAIVKKLVHADDISEQKQKKVVKEEKTVDQVLEKLILIPANATKVTPEVDKVVNEEKKPIANSENVKKQVGEIEMSEQKPKKVVKEEKKLNENCQKPMPISATLKRQLVSPTTHLVTDHSSLKPLPFPVVEDCERFAETQKKLHSIVNLVMWNDVFKSALVFGLGTCIFIVSSFIEDLNISLLCASCYLGLLCLAAIFVYKLVVYGEDTYFYDSSKVPLVGEEEAIWLLKLILPYFNEFLLKIRALFYGDPATTMKLAVFLFVLAQYGRSITTWNIVKMGFFGAFVVPKVCVSYSSQLTNYANVFRGFWHSCPHKKYMALVVFIMVWNFSSMLTRFWAVFMLVLAGRCYQQSLMNDAWVSHDQVEEDKKTIGRESRIHTTQLIYNE